MGCVLNVGFWAVRNGTCNPLVQSVGATTLSFMMRWSSGVERCTHEHVGAISNLGMMVYGSCGWMVVQIACVGALFKFQLTVLEKLSRVNNVGQCNLMV